MSMVIVYNVDYNILMYKSLTGGVFFCFYLVPVLQAIPGFRSLPPKTSIEN
jgi:hypothetical protein